jgi:sugar-phosphatase
LACGAVLFDSDGVLVDSDESVQFAWTRWARALGLSPDEVLPMVHDGRSIETVRLLIEGPQRAEALAMVDRFELEDAARVAAIPGADALVRSIPRARWAVITSAVAALARARLSAAGLPDPPVLVAAEDVVNGKPDPGGYLAAARALHSSPADALVLEDSAAGVQAARAAGVQHVVGVGERALDTDADVVVRDLRDLSWDINGMTVRTTIRDRPRQ